MIKLNLVLPEYVQTVLDLLQNAGHEAYLVGGTVRDAVMGLVPHDFDITTSALPEVTEKLFGDHGYRVINTGLKHGTVTVLCGKEPIEITTFRIDGSYTDARHPENVRFTPCLSEDLSRRDFTVNALVYAPQSGLIDLFGGLDDIAAKTLRCIGEPKKRFSEDALRILRALRFSAKLDFAIEPQTALAAVELRGLLARISAERITSELLILFEKGVPNRLASLLTEFRPIFLQIFPELAALSMEQYVTLCALAARLPTGGEDEACENLRFSYFLAASGCTKELLSHLRLPNAFTKRVNALAEALPEAAHAQSRIDTRKLLSRFGALTCADAAAVLKTNGANPSLTELLNKCLQNSDCVSLTSLAINGQDLARLGFTGPNVGAALNKALFAVMEETVPNTREALLAYLKSTNC